MIKFQKTKTKGKLICLEGLSGAGKTETAKLLAEELRSRGHKVYLYHLNPFDNNLLSRMHQNLEEINKVQPNPLPDYSVKHFNLEPIVIHTQFLLYQISLRKSIMYKLSVCDYVIIDAWVYKNVVYSLLNKVPKNYIMNLVRNSLPKPYLVIFLDIHEKTSLEKGHDMYDDMFTLKDIKTNYYMMRKFAKERWLTVNVLGTEKMQDLLYKDILPRMKKNI